LPEVRKWLETPAEEPDSAKAVAPKGVPALARPAPMPAD